MKNDISRNTFDPVKHFSRVLMQQGRVQLDADWNEQASILLHYLRTLAMDLLGPHAGPVSQCGFEVIDAVAANKLPWGDMSDEAKANAIESAGFFIGAGHYYVDGVLCENEHLVPYSKQSDFRPHDDKKVPKQDGNYVAYLDVWERHISGVEDESIREVALGCADSATRAKVVWQVKLLSLDSKIALPNCDTGASGLQALASRVLPQLRARVKLEEASTDPCVLSAESRYRGQENQLYRVEIHREGGLHQAPTFKWSRENGSVTFPVLELKKDGAEGLTLVTLAHLGRDEKLGLEVEDWVELVNDDYVLRNRAEKLLQVHAIDPVERTVTLIGVSSMSTDPSKHPLLRRWDHQAGDPKQGGLTLADGAAKVVESSDGEDGWLNLEYGVQVQFQKDGEYRTGDYWLIPARTANGDVEWPQEPSGHDIAKPAARPPHGIVHHYAPLAIISVTGGQVKRESDCRRGFEPLRSAYVYQFGGSGIGADLLSPE